MGKEAKNEDRPFGKDGPRVTILSKDEIPKDNSRLTTTGLRILAEDLGMLTDYASFERMIATLRGEGYIEVIPSSGRVRLTEKGERELR